ncbi:hypothetical protein QBC37DRAFT_431898 [Rhypophila decipiens]|uniref:NB-ARC domain-containing protein n=1 Tax=Rhypophila decipiens TaxID=261697 RepID=A0AAN6XX22_9PEZI|nr:hypothetical protein QBC37DRAFT_431898 [Rhypophila decipiens]
MAAYPTLNEIKDDYVSTWEEAIRSAREILGEDDYENVQNIHSPDQLAQKIQCLQKNLKGPRSTVTQLLRGIKTPILHLQTFAVFIASATGSSNSINLACVWGVLYLLIELGVRSDDTLRDVIQYLGELSDNIELFEVYRRSVDLDPELFGRFFAILVDLVLTAAGAIKQLRKNGSWDIVLKNFSKSLKDFSARIDHLRQMVEAHQVTEMSLKQDEVLQSLRRHNLQPQPSDKEANLPYYQLPFGRNPGFYGRTKLLGQIHDALESHGGEQTIRSIALWGIGGIGKSQVALEYANQQVLEKCPLVLWVPAQTATDMSRALVTAAGHVRPPGYEDTMSADRIRFLMWNWLQTTETPWLIVFDNVDDNDLLLSNWPATGNGQVLVTCRSELVAASPAAGAFEIPPFTKEEGATLLLKLARKPSPKPDDAAAAEELSEMLGGLALAIEITASQIFVKKKSMRQFLPYFKKNKLSLRVPPRYAPKNPYYTETLETVWQTAFDSLDGNSSLLLGLLCFFAPDDIPRSIVNTDTMIPDTWPFMSNTEEYEEAEAQLLHMSLIKINEETEMISLHRLVQEAYFYHQPEHLRRETFGVAYRVLCEAFPKRELRRQMYEVWETCELLIHHIEAAQDKYELLRPGGFDVQDPTLQIMLADATWFCGETSSLVLGEKLGRRAAEYCDDKDSLLYAYLCESVATIDHRRGRYQAAYDFFLQSLHIREKEPTTTGPELADAYSAVGLALFGLFKSEESIEYVDKALALAHAAPEEEQHTYNIDRYQRNRSRPQAALKRFEESKIDVGAAEAFQTKVYGPDSHFHGETAYILGKIAYQEGDLELAMKYLQRAYDLQYPGKPTHQSVASALYHQALVCMRWPTDREQRDEQALNYLRQALIITQFNEPRRGDQGETARVKWQISKIWDRQGRTADAAMYRTAALRAKVELERTGLHPKAPDEEQSWDCFSDLVDR